WDAGNRRSDAYKRSRVNFLRELHEPQRSCYGILSIPTLCRGSAIPLDKRTPVVARLTTARRVRHSCWLAAAFWPVAGKLLAGCKTDSESSGAFVSASR